MLAWLRTLLQGREDKNAIADEVGVKRVELDSFIEGQIDISATTLAKLMDACDYEWRPKEHRPLLPLETKCLAEIRAIHADSFRSARYVMTLGMRAVGIQEDGITSMLVPRNAKLSKDTVDLCVGIFAKVCKQYRATIALFELGLVQDAGSITRSLFESVLALMFILKPDVELKEDGIPIRTVGSKYHKCKNCHHVEQAIPKKSMPNPSANDRAALYAGKGRYDLLASFRGCVKRGFPELAANIGKEEDLIANVEQVKQRIGDDWVEKQKRSGSYSGMSVANLAHSYGLDHVYDTMYRAQSRTIHGSDGYAFLFVDEDSERLSVDLVPSAKGTRLQLHIASVIFAMGVETLCLGLHLPTENGFKDLHTYMFERGEIIDEEEE